MIVLKSVALSLTIHLRLAASYIATQLYLGYAQVIFASRVFWGEYNITETASFNITLRDNAKYHCETCLTISLNILIFEIG